MSNTRAIAPIERGNWQTMVEQASTLVKSGFLPSHIKTPEQAVAVMLTGQELGIPAMTALRTVAVIQGKVALQAELMAALIERDYGANALRVEETDDTACTVSYWKPGWQDRKHYTFTMQAAKQAGITNNPTWGKYPAAMLRARCISAVAKMAFQATLGGIYTPEEMGAPVTVTEDGEVVYDPPSDEPKPRMVAISDSVGGPLGKLSLDDAEAVWKHLKEHTTYSTMDLRGWLAFHGKGGLTELTEAQADELKRDAVANRRPWQAKKAPEHEPAQDKSYNQEPPAEVLTGELIGDDFDAEDGEVSA